MRNDLPTQASPLCDDCKHHLSSFTRDICNEGRTFPIQSPIISIHLKKALTSSCSFCILLASSIEVKLRDFSADHMDIRLRLDRLDVTSNIVAIIKANEDEPVFVRNRGTLQMFTTAGSYSAKFITGRAVGEPGSSLSLENICRAADMCREGHEGCRRGLLGSDMETDPELPRRVLDVSSPTEPRLFVTNGARAQFVVLSHRWFGRISQAMTLRSNIQDFRDGIPLASLPKVFRDAITVTRALGFDYLWIDSLCIIQDSQEDWLSEAEAMGSTFEKAFCTISATGAQDVSQGCFIQNTSYEKAVTFIPELEGNKAAPVYFSKQRPGVGAAYFDEGPLSNRAWVLQERILSRRILHFSPDQIYWECRQTLLAENGSVPRNSALAELRTKVSSTVYSSLNIPYHPSAMTPQSSTLQLTPSYFPGTSEPRTADFRDAEINSINLWLDVVQCYTKCRATMSSDKLPAILGLLGKIKQVARLTDHYGVIFDESPTSLRTLLWYRAQPSLFKPKPWRAPSWSWAALDGAILMPYRSIHRDVGGIHDCVLRSLGWAPPPYYPTAELIRFERHEEREDVQLTISAPLFEMETLFTPAPVGRDTKCPHSEEWPAGTYLATVVNGDKNLDDTHRVCFDSWEDTPPKFYLAVFFLHQRVHKFNNSMLTVRICLALRKAGRDRWENTRYRRVGLGMVAGDHPLPDKQVITLV